MDVNLGSNYSECKQPNRSALTSHNTFQHSPARARRSVGSMASVPISLLASRFCCFASASIKLHLPQALTPHKPSAHPTARLLQTGCRSQFAFPKRHVGFLENVRMFALGQIKSGDRTNLAYPRGLTHCTSSQSARSGRGIAKTTSPPQHTTICGSSSSGSIGLGACVAIKTWTDNWRMPSRSTNRSNRTANSDLVGTLSSSENS